MYKVTRNKIELQSGDPCGRNWPLIVTVTSEELGADPNVFVYHTDPDSKTGAMFSNVASMQDMDLIAVDESTFLPEENGTENNIPYYRTNTVELNFYNLDELSRCWDIIKTDIASLVQEYKVLEKQHLLEQEEITI